MRILQLLILLTFYGALFPKAKISLSGFWQFETDPKDVGIRETWFSRTLGDSIELPGSMTERNKGFNVSINTIWTGNIIDSSFFKNPEYESYRRPDNFKVPFWLQPLKSFYGIAWYRRELIIPTSWKNKSIQLFIERCHWQSQIWIDNTSAGSNNALGAPHIFDLTGKLTPGKHYLSICIDNRIRAVNPGVNSSSLTDHTQTNWNGIIGEMFLEARDLICFGSIRIFPDIYNKSCSVEMQINNLTGANKKVLLSLKAESDLSMKEQTFGEVITEITLKPGENKINTIYSLGKTALLWDEFNSTVYRLRCELNSENYADSTEETFGLRKLGIKGTQFTINDKLIFLRGTLECAIFPKTGYPSTDVKEWTRIFKICKDHGLNHMRFHSWCPPEAAFIAADNIGIYLQVECSSWANQGSQIGNGEPIDQYIYNESERITAAFGNHPSFCFLLYGNEPDGANQEKYLSDFITHWKNKDSRRLYAGASGWPRLEINDFHIMYEPRIQLWGAGLNSIINKEAPASDFDWSNIINRINKPVISHEIGQWCVYPDFEEIKKYDGILKANNFEIFRQTLKQNGMPDLADSFKMASGKLQVLCYKSEIEAALRTKHMGGFQLLDLHDFPGQGTALVGVLNPFWEEKGYITPSEYKKFCSTTVPLVRLEKFIFNSEEDFMGAVEVSHFGPAPLKGITPEWEVIDESGKKIKTGNLPKTNIPVDNGTALGLIHFPLKSFRTPAMYTISVNIGEFKNDWNFWVYPFENSDKILHNDVRIVHALNKDDIKYLNNGGKVLLTPRNGTIQPDKGGDIAVGFSSIFWNTAWTQGQPPHTLGILCNPKHPLLKEFPTQYHSNYQWWDALSHANAVLLSALGSNIQPVVRIIDDWFKNRPIGLIIEAKTGKGKIVISGIDLLSDSAKRPEARQLVHSIIKYMQSELFNPIQEISQERIVDLLKSQDQ